VAALCTCIVVPAAMLASASSSTKKPPQSMTNPSDLWKAAAGGGGHDLTWDQLYYSEKNTFLELDELESQGKPLRRVQSDSSLSTLTTGSLTRAFTPGLSTASNATQSALQPRWYHGCYMKYCMGACNAPNCTHLHDLTDDETSSFIAWTQRKNHVVFRSDRSDSSVQLEAGYRECRVLGDDSEVSSDENIVEAPPDSRNRPDGQSQPQFTDGGKSKARPCKGKRDRYRKLVSRISKQIMADPFSWSAEMIYIPPSVDCNPELKRKFMARMAAIAERARTEAAQAASSSGATGTIILPQGSCNVGMGVTAQDPASATAADLGDQHLPSAIEPTQPRKLFSL